MANLLNIVLIVCVIYISSGDAQALGPLPKIIKDGTMRPVHPDKPCLACDCSPGNYVSHRVRNPENCNSFCYCVWGRSVWMDCPKEKPGQPGLLRFSRETQNCEWSHTVNDCNVPEKPCSNGTSA